MADFNSSLPIRTETNGDAVVKVVDGTTVSQALGVDASGRVTTNQGLPGTAANGWFARVTDGTDNLAITAAGEATVSVTQPLPAGNNNIGDVDANMRDGAGTALTSTLVNSKQSLDVQTSAHGTDGAAKPFGTMQIGGSDGTNLQALSVDTNGQLKVNLFDEAGVAFSGANPLPVTFSAAASGDEVLDFKQAAAVAAAASDTHTYTVTATKTLSLQKIVASGSGKIKVQISLGITASEVLKIVLFNSTANPNVEYAFSSPQQMPDTMSVKVVITNLDKQAQDLYSTIEGVEN